MGKVIQVAEAAKAAKSAMNRLNTIEKNRILEAMAAGLLSHTEKDYEAKCA